MYGKIQRSHSGTKNMQLFFKQKGKQRYTEKKFSLPVICMLGQNLDKGTSQNLDWRSLKKRKLY